MSVAVMQHYEEVNGFNVDISSQHETSSLCDAFLTPCCCDATEISEEAFKLVVAAVSHRIRSFCLLQFEEGEEEEETGVSGVWVRFSVSTSRPACLSCLVVPCNNLPICSQTQQTPTLSQCCREFRCFSLLYPHPRPLPTTIQPHAASQTPTPSPASCSSVSHECVPLGTSCALITAYVFML